jgi:hypothetical protein
MAIEYPGNAIPNAGFRTGNRVVDDELLVSTNGGFTQKGVTLKAGQGILPLGTILARETASKKYVKYAATGGAAGANVARGILRSTVDTGSDAAGQEYLNNIVIRGILNLTKVKTANSGVDLATILGARTDDVWNTFTF